MSYFEDIDKHINNIFGSYANVEVLGALPKKEELNEMEKNQLFQVDFAAIAVDVVGFKNLSKYSNKEALNAVMNEFTYGVTKIMKNFYQPERIDIQGDGIYAIFRITSKAHIDEIFTTLCGLNSFRKHIKKKVINTFGSEIKNSAYSYESDVFEFGIGASYSFENYISKVGHGSDTDLIFMGHAVNCANELAKKANRNNRKSIIFDSIFYLNLTDKEKNRIKQIGGVSTIRGHYSYDETLYETNWVMKNYDNFIINNVR